MRLYHHSDHREQPAGRPPGRLFTTWERGTLLHSFFPARFLHPFCTAMVLVRSGQTCYAGSGSR